MDPIAHTLVGASMAETGAKNSSRLATATLMIGANLPDIDALATALGQEAMYGLRRGWTHGALAMVVLPALLAGAMTLYGRWRPPKDPDDGPPLRPWHLLAFSYISVWSHPALDWLNNYGVRLLMPFDDTWFYGDALFIVDPWMWLSMAAAVVLARSNSKMSLGAWSVLGLASTGLITAVDTVPLLAKVVWFTAVAAIVFARARPDIVKRSALIARAALVFLTLYIASMLGATALARQQAHQWFTQQDLNVTHVMAGPLPANPFVRDIIAVTPTTYHFARLDWLSDPVLTNNRLPMAIGDQLPEAKAVLKSPKLAGFNHWTRFPSYTVTPNPDGGHTVHIQDVRYTRMKGARIGKATVTLDNQLQVLEVSFGAKDNHAHH